MYLQHKESILLFFYLVLRKKDKKKTLHNRFRNVVELKWILV